MVNGLINSLVFSNYSLIHSFHMFIEINSIIDHKNGEVDFGRVYVGAANVRFFSLQCNNEQTSEWMGETTTFLFETTDTHIHSLPITETD